jgi:glycosyltransferase involved in cell wall biosynthesis
MGAQILIQQNSSFVEGHPNKLKKSTLILIPVYNEGDVIQKVAHRTLEYGSSFANILFINDGSTDSSKNELELLKEKYSEIQVLHKPKNQGYGASLISGIDYSIQNNYEYCITMDCDDQHQPSDLPRFREFDPSIDLVSGSRYLPESGIKGIMPPIDRVEINRRITALLNKRYQLSITDAFCGFKRYKLSSFLNHGFQEQGYASPLELWSYVYHFSKSIKELAVDRIYITDDRSFGEDLDKKRKRYQYYLHVWKRSHKIYEKQSKVSK